MEYTIIELASQLGAPTLIAVVILMFWRRDRRSLERSAREDRMFMEDRLTRIIEGDQQSRENNTKAVTEMTVLLRLINGRLSRG